MSKGSASAFIVIGSDNYFDNETVSEQFERLLRLIKFKKGFRGHRIEIVVDNARTHTARAYTLHDFGKSSGTRCPVDAIEYQDENGKHQIHNTYFTHGPKLGSSKGLFQIAKELGISLSSKIKLDELRNKLDKHPAFCNVSHTL